MEIIKASIPCPETGGEVIVVDELPPEAVAMAQALYSRDPRSVRYHIEEIQKRGPEKFMAQYYVGYGHKSIGDCGTTSLFIENVSMLCAKAIQDWPLYSGQEASTRYLDMTAQKCINPFGTPLGEEIQGRCMALYKRVLNHLKEDFRVKYPQQPAEDLRVWSKAVDARAFDVARAFIPAGCTTYLSWHTNLRQAADHLVYLRQHPSSEIASIANCIEAALTQAYPSSFSSKRYAEQEGYILRRAFYKSVVAKHPLFEASECLDLELLEEFENSGRMFSSRPEKTEVPYIAGAIGNMRFKFLLDFGSFRDLQRHRNMYMQMPLLTTAHGFHPWYIEQLTPTWRPVVERELALIAKLIGELGLGSSAARQYYIPMGYQVPVDMTMGLPQAVYMAELRSMQTVHPTLRVIAQRMGRFIEGSTTTIPDFKLFADYSPDQWSTRRGLHDITKSAS